MKKIYYCACEQKCKGVQQKVARATYHRHKEYRNQDRQNKYSLSMQAFLNAHPIILRTSSSHAVQRSRVHVSGLSEEDAEHPIGPFPPPRSSPSADAPPWEDAEASQTLGLGDRAPSPLAATCPAETCSLGGRLPILTRPSEDP